jgi:aspartyl-tRNA(Asn)/glutamyl-tRNA(Gln) amidotransferase subunit C
MAKTLDSQTVARVAKLARLNLTGEEITAISSQMSAVLANFEKIAQVVTTGVRPLVTPTEMTSSMRQDEVKKPTETDALLDSAPEKSGRLYKVPPVV